MTDPTPTGPDLQDGTLRFLGFHEPPLDAGHYRIEVEQTLEVTPPRGAPRRESIPRTVREFSIAGPKFVLDPAQVVGVFPPPGSEGDHGFVLPHVVLRRSTLPWERSPGVDGSRSWLALLVFDADHAPEPKALPLGQLLERPEFRGARDDTLEPHDRQVKILEFDRTTAAALLPTAADLHWLAHVRADDQGVASAVVLANRLPKADGDSVVHLVSIEGCYDERGLAASRFPGPTATLVSLHSWKFACLSPELSFRGLLENLDTAPCDLRRAAPTDAVDARLADGRIPLPHHLRNGQRTTSWYRSPLAARRIDTELRLPARTADELLRFEPDTGLLDTSYAAAWELGRLLALRDTAFALELFKWKRSHTRSLRAARQRLFHAHLPQPTGERSPDDPPGTVLEWFARLDRLEGIPFPYLVPDPDLLPPESLRWFHVDPSWIQCMKDGAFSIGRVTQTDLSTPLPSQSDHSEPARTGVLLRSRAVAGWPDLLVDGYGTPGADDLLPAIRVERLGDDTLLCLFAGTLEIIDFRQKPERVHFGIDAPDEQHDLPYKELRNRADGTVERTVPVPWRGATEQRVVDFQQLATSIDRSLGRASFALHMVEGTTRVRFRRGSLLGTA